MTEYDSLTDDPEAPPPEVIVGAGYALDPTGNRPYRVRRRSQFGGVVAHHARMAALDTAVTVLGLGSVAAIYAWGKAWPVDLSAALICLLCVHWFRVRRMEHSVRRPGTGTRDRY